jgi:hypothetical protein
MEDGDGLTVTAIVAMPQASVYVIIVVPPETPVTTPDDGLMVATAVLLLVQVPPVIVSLSGIIAPAQTVAGPEIEKGALLTVTTAVA